MNELRVGGHGDVHGKDDETLKEDEICGEELRRGGHHPSTHREHIQQPNVAGHVDGEEGGEDAPVVAVRGLEEG